MPDAMPHISYGNMILNISDVKLPERWNRTGLGDISGLVQSIKDRGQLIPVLVRIDPEEDGKVVLVDGMRRMAALKSIGATEVTVSLVASENDVEAFQDSMVANSNAEPNTPYELAISYDLMVEKDGKTHEEIARSCGKTSGHVSQLRGALRIARTNTELLTAFQSGAVAYSVFRHLSRLDPDKDKRMIAKMTALALKGTSAQRIGAKIDHYLQDKPGEKKKRGAAAHKKAQLDLVDYSLPEQQARISPVKAKSKYQELLVYQTDAVRRCTKKMDQTFARGVLLGLEIAAGIVELTD